MDVGPGRFADSGIAGLPQNKRYITTHDGSGKSVYVAGSDQAFWRAPDGSIGACRSFTVGQVPADLAGETDIKAYRSEEGDLSYTGTQVTLSQPGVNCVVVDIAPGTVGPFHRTVSVDFAACVFGELDHELDNGEIVRLKPGDHIVQRGTMHRWINPSKTQPARMFGCVVPCAPFTVGGKPIEEEWGQRNS